MGTIMKNRQLDINLDDELIIEVNGQQFLLKFSSVAITTHHGEMAKAKAEAKLEGFRYVEEETYDIGTV